MKPEINSDELKLAVLNRITSEQLCPRPRFLFMTRECLIWTLWITIVLIAAVAVAMTLLVVNYQRFALYEVTHSSVFSFVLEALPLLWLLVIVGMVILAVYDLRLTRRGYRYTFPQILGGSFALSFFLGLLLHMVGLNFAIDTMAGSRVPGYMSQAQLEMKRWQRPSEGRLVGFLTVSNDSATNTALFNDVERVLWQTDLDELHAEEIELLRSQAQVRLVGFIVAPTPPHFHACGVFPWIYDKKQHTAHEMSEFKQAMKSRLSEHQAQPKDNFQVLKVSVPGEISSCAELKMLSRLNPATGS